MSAPSWLHPSEMMLPTSQQCMGGCTGTQSTRVPVRLLWAGGGDYRISSTFWGLKAAECLHFLCKSLPQPPHMLTIPLKLLQWVESVCVCLECLSVRVIVWVGVCVSICECYSGGGGGKRKHARCFCKCLKWQMIPAALFAVTQRSRSSFLSRTDAEQRWSFAAWFQQSTHSRFTPSLQKEVHISLLQHKNCHTGLPPRCRVTWGESTHTTM